MSPSTLMRAAILEKHGAPFRLMDIPRPVPGPGQVLVRIVASGVNPLDTKIHEGLAQHARHPLPAILGLDLAGVVEQVGAEVDGFGPGDDVFGMTGGVGGLQGSLAEYAAVDARLLARKPANLTHREAAALPLVFITAWEGLVDRAGLVEGETVLVLGGGGGVGRSTIQLARALGAEVFATDRPERADAIERLGAVAIDRAEPIESVVQRLTGGRGFDLVYDTVGGAVLDSAFHAVRQHGRVVSALGWGTHALAPLSFRGASYSGVFTLAPLLSGEGRARFGAVLRRAAQLVEAGQVHVKLDPRRYELSTLCEAYRRLKAGAAEGKLVIDLA